MFDTIVIGSGMAGATAAFTLQKEGLSVALASRSWGATAMSTGALDLAYTPALSPLYERRRSIAEHVRDIAAHRRRHPFSVLGPKTTTKALATGLGLVCDHLEKVAPGLAPREFTLDDYNLTLPSSLGVAIPVGGALAPHQGIDLATIDKKVGVVGLLGDPYFDAVRVAKGLEHDIRLHNQRDVDFIPILVDAPLGSSPATTARLYDDIANVDLLADAILSQKSGAEVYIIPPMLGFEKYGAARAHLKERLEAKVVEALAHIPSVPGVRLQKALDRALDQAGIARLGEISSGLCEGTTLQGVKTIDNIDINAGAVILATGRFVSGGIEYKNEISEPIFGLSAYSEEGQLENTSPQASLRATPMESHPLMTAGVRVADDLRPLREGHAAFTNLFAAGMVIGGFASRYALCADGVALATGHLAAMAALKAAGERGS